jgi:hypothetical protein
MILRNTRRRVWRRTADVLAVAYRYAAHRRNLLTPEGSRPRTGGVLVEPIRNVAGRIVVPAGYAQGRADLQLTHRAVDPKANAEEFWRRIDAERPELRADAEESLARYLRIAHGEQP